MHSCSSHLADATASRSHGDTQLRVSGSPWLLSQALVAEMLVVTSDHAQEAKPVRSGEELYRFACAACHGADGTGAPQSQVGFDDPVPDFTDCSFNTPEAAADWLAIAHDGGPVRAFSKRMPAFGSALTVAELERTVAYVRGFCEDRAWPRGDLNFPRALVTE